MFDLNLLIGTCKTHADHIFCYYVITFVYSLTQINLIMKEINIIKVKNLLNQGVFELNSTQERLCYPIVERIYKKMLVGIKFPGIKVDKDHIIDGHHRYIASLLTDLSIERYPSTKTLAAKKSDWNMVDLVAEDWDTKEEILMWIQIDALYNNMEIEELIKLTK